MLFDLRGRGRRRTVQIIYGGLAVLIGLGLIGLGVGGGFGSSGILNSLSGNEGTGGASFSAQIDKYRKLTQKQPSNPEAWEQLTRAQLHEAGGEAYVNPTTGAVSAKGRELFAQAARSWEGYLALNLPKPNVELAKLMAQRVYTPQALNQPAAAVRALQIVVAAEPNSASWYSQLAEFAYLAKNTRVGDLAAAKAVALAPAPQRKQLQKQLAEVKKYPNGRPEASAGQAASGAGSAAGKTTVPTQSSTSTGTVPSTTVPSTTVPSTTAPPSTKK